jgi:hypothetical protein
MNKNMEAFPRPASRGNNYLTGEEDVVVDPQRGMTLRDYFAAKAMQGAIAHGLFNADKASSDYAEYVATVAYVYADAMLKAREV